MYERKKMSEKIYKLYRSDGHISDELMLRYVNGSLSPAEEHVVERHCLDCELCGDALEGLMLVEDKTQIETVVKDLKKKALSKSEGPKVIRMNTRTWLSLAAGVALVFTVGYLFMNQYSEEKSQQAFNDNFTPISPEAMDSVGALAEKDSSTDTKTIVADQPKLSKGPEEFKSIEPDVSREYEESVTSTISTDDNTVKDESGKFGVAPPPPPVSQDIPKDVLKKNPDPEYKSPVPVQDNKNFEQNEKQKEENYYSKGKDKKNLSEKPNSTTGNNSQINQHSNDGDKIVNQTQNETKNVPSPKKQDGYLNGELMDLEKEKDELGKTMTDSVSQNSYSFFMTDGLKRYDGKDYQGAQVQFEKEIAVNPSNTKAVLYNAICALSLGDANKSILLLDKVLLDTSSPYYETAQWYKALALIKQNEKKKAKKLLETIIKKGGGYKTKAEAALKDLK